MKAPKLALTSLAIIAMLTLTISVVAHGNDPDNTEMPGMNPPHRPMVGNNGYHAMGGHIEIVGEISVETAINITLTAQPSEEMNQMMESGQMPMRGGGHMRNEDMRMSMTVLVSKLVEYEDQGNQGYDENDTIISQYNLNSSTLNQVQFFNNSGLVEYVVSLPDNVFLLQLIVNTTSKLPNEWKWSYEIKYPFTSPTSKIAVFHTLIAPNANLMADQHRMDQIARFQHMKNQQIIANHSMLPMFFTWDRTAIVDGNEADVTATAQKGEIALSYP